VRRVAILGSGGAGKTSFAVELGRRTGLPVVHLDLLNFAPGWVARPLGEFRATLAAAVAEERWILDGDSSRATPTILVSPARTPSSSWIFRARRASGALSCVACATAA
jgi:adenylate kinase family enzyme